MPASARHPASPDFSRIPGNIAAASSSVSSISFRLRVRPDIRDGRVDRASHEAIVNRASSYRRALPPGPVDRRQQVTRGGAPSAELEHERVDLGDTGIAWMQRGWKRQPDGPGRSVALLSHEPTGAAIEGAGPRRDGPQQGAGCRDGCGSRVDPLRRTSSTILPEVHDGTRLPTARATPIVGDHEVGKAVTLLEVLEQPRIWTGSRRRAPARGSSSDEHPRSQRDRPARSRPVAAGRRSAPWRAAVDEVRRGRERHGLEQLRDPGSPAGAAGGRSGAAAARRGCCPIVLRGLSAPSGFCERRFGASSRKRSRSRPRGASRCRPPASGRNRTTSVEAEDQARRAWTCPSRLADDRTVSPARQREAHAVDRGDAAPSASRGSARRPGREGLRGHVDVEVAAVGIYGRPPPRPRGARWAPTASYASVSRQHSE